jgi:hypothetical protein
MLVSSLRSRSREFFRSRNNSKESFQKNDTKYIIIGQQEKDHDNKIANQRNISENQIAHLREIIKNLKAQWLRYVKSGLDWNGMLNPCKTDMQWESKKTEITNRTSGNTSKIISKDIEPAGEFSRVLIQSRTADGRIKTMGGDAWRVYLFGPSSLVARVFDYSNGTYEALFLVMEPGVYKVVVVLDYSLCDGLRDPPRDWFIKGNL